MRSTLSLSLLIALVIFGFAGYNGYTKYQQLSIVKQNISSADKLVDTLIQEDKPDSEGAIGEAKDAKIGLVYDLDLKKLFPPLAFKTALYKDFENYFFSLNSEKEPMIVNTINIPDPVNDKELGAGVIKIQLNIESSEANFYKFMKWIENSGNLSELTEAKKATNATATKEADQTAPRLMAIESIQIQLPDKSKEAEEEAEKAAPEETPSETGEAEPEKVPTFQYNVTLNTYVQLQPELAS